MKQIYFFNTQGVCVQRSSTQAIGKDLRDEINRHIAVLPDPDQIQTLVSDLSYTMDEIYYASGSLRMRPQNPATINGMVLSNLPVPCVVAIKGVKSQSYESELTLSFTYPGVYDVCIEAWPYLDRIFKVTQP